MLQTDTPRDLILATGQATTLQAFLVRAFETVGLDWQDHVVSDPRFVRLAEPVHLFGDTSEAASHIDWRAKVVGTDVAELMVRAEL
jgi:GDPmannose 4,6-dehydratase